MTSKTRPHHVAKKRKKRPVKRRPAPRHGRSARIPTKKSRAHAKQILKRVRRPAFIHARDAHPRIGHRLHLSFDASLDAVPPATATVPVTPLDPTPHFDVTYESTLPQDGVALAGYLRSACEFDLQRTANIFGVKWDTLHFTITVLRSNSGAWHPDPCSNTNIFIGANSSRLPDGSPDYLFLRAMVLSEIIEVLGDGFGWNCGWSNGEGLSRALSDFLVPCQRPANFLSAKVWLAPPSTREDYVSKSFQGDDDHPGDRDYPSIGCSVLFLNWMRFQRGLSWEDIARNGANTLGQTYQALVNDGTNGFAEFTALLNQSASIVRSKASTSDNVFPI
jgi:hypothetical protein